MTASLTQTVANYLDGLIREDLDPEVIARALLRDAEEVDGTVRIEVPSKWTIDGNPLPASFPAE